MQGHRKFWGCGELGHRAADCPNKTGKGKDTVNELQDFVHSILASAGIANPESEPQDGDADCWECEEGFIDPNGQWHDWEEEGPAEESGTAAKSNAVGTLRRLGAITRAPPPPPTQHGNDAFRQAQGNGDGEDCEGPLSVVDSDSECESAPEGYASATTLAMTPAMAVIPTTCSMDARNC